MKRSSLIWILTLASWAVLCGLYLLWGRALALELVKGSGPEGLQALAEQLYPRLVVERERLPLHFFAGRTDQILYRASLVLFLLYLGFGLRWGDAFRRKLQAPLQVDISTQSRQWLERLFWGALLFFTWDWAIDLYQYERLAAFYKPVAWLRLMHPVFPAADWLAVVQGIMVVAIGVVAFRRKPQWVYWVITLSYLYLQAFFFSFEKTDHRFAPLTWVLLILALWPWAKLKQAKGLGLIRLALAMQYLAAGLEKLLSAGTDWVAAEALAAFIIQYEQPAGMALLEYGWLLSLLALGNLLFQLGFVSVLWWPRLRWWWISLALCFHTGTWLLLGISDLLNPWVFCLVFFLPWEDRGWRATRDKAATAV